MSAMLFSDLKVQSVEQNVHHQFDEKNSKKVGVGGRRRAFVVKVARC